MASVYAASFGRWIVEQYSRRQGVYVGDRLRSWHGGNAARNATTTYQQSNRSAKFVERLKDQFADN